MLGVLVGTVLVGCDRSPDASGGNRPAATGVQSSGADILPSPTGPSIRFASMEHDFGSLWVGQEESCEFEFSNTGTERLVINKITTTCGCTAAQPSRTELEPGETSVIRATFKPTTSGRQTKHVMVVSNDVTTPTARLAVSAMCKDVVTCSPQLVEFGEVRLGTSHTRMVMVSALDPRMVVDDVKVAGWGFDVRALERQEAEGPWQLEVTLNDTASWGMAYSSVSVTCRGDLIPGRGPGEHVARFNARGSVFGELRADKTMFSFRAYSAADFTDTVRLNRLADEPFQVLSTNVKSTSPVQDMEVRAEPISGRNEYRLILSGRSPADYAGKFAALAEIMTDVPGEERLPLQISGFIVEPDS
jgi:hypothetical protein